MVRIVFEGAGGGATAIDAVPGVSLMQNAKDCDVPGIEAECGGSMVCGTCQVYVPEPWYSALGGPSPMEAEMLAFTAHPRAGGRLSCQIEVTAALAGMTVATPPSQR